MSMDDAESTLAECCISFLNLEDFDKKRSDKDETIEIWEDSGFRTISISPELTPKSPISISRDYNHIYHEPRTQFFEYAASTRGFHYSSSESAGAGLTTAALTLSTRTNTLFNWSRQFRRSYRGCDKLPESLDPLIVAAYFGHNSVATRLISNNDFGPSSNAALTQASRMGHLKIVNLLINHGIPNIREMYDGASAFSWATAGGFLEIVNALLACDKSLINVTNANGNCPLSLAVSNQHLEVVDRLLGTENIDVNLMGDQGSTPIFFAFGRDDLSAIEEEIFIKLLRSVAEAFCRMPQDMVSQKPSRNCSNAGKDKKIPKGFLNDVGDNEGLSPLSHAARWGHIDAVRVLCETKQIDSQLWSVDKLDGANAFDLAATTGQVQVIKELIKHHSDGVNNRDLSGRTPLIYSYVGKRSRGLESIA